VLHQLVGGFSRNTADRAYKPTFSPDGRFLGVIYANGRGRVFSLDRSPAGGVARLEATWGDISSIDFAPDSTAIVALSTAPRRRRLRCYEPAAAAEAHA
jgi:hypothetical protein